MNSKNRAANPGLLVMALLLVLLALVVVLIAVILATGNGNKDGNDKPIEYNGTTTNQSLDNSTTVPNTTLPGGSTADSTSGQTPSTGTPNTGTSTTTVSNVQTTTTPSTGTGTPSTGKNTIQVNSSAINKGALLLVDKNHLISHKEKFPKRSEFEKNAELQKEFGFVQVANKIGNVSYPFTLPKYTLYLNEQAFAHFRDMMVEFDKENNFKGVHLRNAYYCDYGEEIPHANISVTGNAVDLQLYVDGKQYPLKSNSEYYEWFKENCWKYGFIYCGDTNIYSSFRFIGTAHAKCMKIYSMNLEEYLEYITNRTPENCIRITDEYGVEWMIYYVKASSGETTEITVFGDESCYEISGDNKAGFVVTVNASKLG